MQLLVTIQTYTIGGRVQVGLVVQALRYSGSYTILINYAYCYYSIYLFSSLHLINIDLDRVDKP